MKKTQVLLTSLIALVLVMPPVAVFAQDAVPSPGPLPPLLITEVQPGTTASASEEFIELINTSNQRIDLQDFGWRLEIASSTATSWTSPLRTIPLEGTLLPGDRLLVASQYTSGGQEVVYFSEVADVWFSAGMAATTGHVRLLYATNQLINGACVPSDTVVDQVEWSTLPNALLSNPSLDSRAVFLSQTSSGIAKTVSLQRMINPTGFLSDRGNDSVDFTTALPTPKLAPTVTMGITYENDPAVPFPVHGCDPNEPEEPEEETPPEEESPESPEEPETPEPPTTPTLLPPQITELLPNPAAPQTDAADEFVELYNPNNEPLDISGYTLFAGTNGTYRFVFPATTLLAPQAYEVFKSSQTKLSLSNSGGRVWLTNADDVTIAESAPYTAAKDGQAWTLLDGTWQWTTQPTPGAVNVSVPAPLPAIKAATTTKKKVAAPKKAAAQKVPKAKTAKPKKEKVKKDSTQKTATLTSAEKPPASPVHPGILAAAAVFALLYGAYEYRGDLANKIHQLRSNRAARRKTGQGP